MSEPIKLSDAAQRLFDALVLGAAEMRPACAKSFIEGFLCCYGASGGFQFVEELTTRTPALYLKVVLQARRHNKEAV